MPWRLFCGAKTGGEQETEINAGAQLDCSCYFLLDFRRNIVLLVAYIVLKWLVDHKSFGRLPFTLRRWAKFIFGFLRIDANQCKRSIILTLITDFNVKHKLIVLFSIV